MPRKKQKKNTVQLVASVATAGMPAPVQKVASSKIGSLLLVAALVAAAATGVVTVSWSGWLPSVTVNEARTQELKRQVETQARMAVGRITQDRGQAGVR